MKRLIYYPTLEPQDINWLKYALIYIDNFSPIIPKSAENKITDVFKSITDNTDLITILKPTYNQGDRASTKTLVELENIQRFPNQYRDKFNVVNIEKTLKDVGNWDYKILKEKFNMDFGDEILKRGLGIQVKEGIRTSSELGNLFMIFLSEEIAKDEKGNPITDITKYDNLTTYIRSIDINQHDVPAHFIRTIIDLSLPKNIQDIPVEKLIEFRNYSEINELRNKLNIGLSNFYKSLENGTDPHQYLKFIEQNSNELAQQILLFFGGLFGVSLAASTIMSNPLSTESIKEITEGTLMSVEAISAIKSAWSSNGEKRAARKFLTKLNQI
ncbi:hypothetical protein [Chryseobacterium indoltheticum]|uniref:Uncharacterized protein n=1 Tax=Chryseobacterium indoltheticum TaxID=254 RepID=A0A381FF20_9FLAO|nr:hypothetical protein [Chryseobacterium indoltheticum]SUX45156.1 Uncharacterised protein [Chryseobacterium indoltheticum]